MNANQIFKKIERGVRWHKRFLEMAKLISTWSKDPSTQCGAVIIDAKKRVISMGFNGFPSGTSDDPDLYQNREKKYKRVIHAEKNAILFAKQDLSGCSLYVWPMPPCAQCAAAIIQSGIKKVITPDNFEDKVDRWEEDFKQTQQMFREACVEMLFISNISKQENCELFEARIHKKNEEEKENTKEIVETEYDVRTEAAHTLVHFGWVETSPGRFQPPNFLMSLPKSFSILNAVDVQRYFGGNKEEEKIFSKLYQRLWERIVEG